MIKKNMLRQMAFLLPLLAVSLSAPAQAVLSFAYDASGNQTYRGYTGSAQRAQAAVAQNAPESLSGEVAALAEKFTLVPNPTTGRVVLGWPSGMGEDLYRIVLVSPIAGQTTTVARQGHMRAALDLAPYPSGFYLVRFYLKNRPVPVVQKRIIKL